MSLFNAPFFDISLCILGGKIQSFQGSSAQGAFRKIGEVASQGVTLP